MPNEQIRHGTELSAVLEDTYSPTMAREANEATAIVKDFARGGVSKIGNQLNITKVAVVSAQTNTPNDMSVSGLTFEQDTESNITVDPSWAYAGIGLQKPAQLRFLRSAAYAAAKKQQIIAGLKAYIDTQGGTLGAALATNIVGGSGQRITKTLILQAMAKLRAGAKEYFQMGGMAHLVAYHLQFPDLFGILDITSAEMRGDATNPNVTGRIVRAWGLTIETSGNISTAAGAAHNMLWVPNAFVIGWNQEPTFEEPQKNGLVTYLIASTEFGVGEVFDAHAVDIQTATT